MCESAVYLLKGSQRIEVMHEAARVMVSGGSVVCVDTIGETITVPEASIAEANLSRHEVILKGR